MNKTDPKFPQIRSLSKPIIRNSASPSHDSFAAEVPSLFACQNELERTKENIYHLKKAINKKSNEITQTKADITRYEETLKKNLKIIEDISLTTDKSTSIAIGKLLFDPNQTNLPTEMTLSSSHIVKFKELLAVNVLKSKNKELSEAVSSKKLEIDGLKSDSKTNAITKLENTFLLNATELKELKVNYDSLQLKYKEMYTQAEKIIEERDQLKSDMNKYKAEYLYTKAKLAQLKSNKLSKSNFNDSAILSNDKRESMRKDFSSNSSQHTKEQSDITSLNKKSVAIDNGKIMINAYASEKAKLETKIEELCNANLEADERNEAKESQLKKKHEEYNSLLEKRKKLQHELEAKKRDSDKEEALKQQIDKLKKEKNALNEKINNVKEKDMSAKLNEVIEKVKEIEEDIKAQKNKNIELKETIESDKINERILEKKINEDKVKIDKLKKEIEEMKQKQKLEKQNKQDNFFATGINVNAMSRYEPDQMNENEAVSELEQEQEQEQDKDIEEQGQQEQGVEEDKGEKLEEANEINNNENEDGVNVEGDHPKEEKNQLEENDLEKELEDEQEQEQEHQVQKQEQEQELEEAQQHEDNNENSEQLHEDDNIDL